MCAQMYKDVNKLHVTRRMEKCMSQRGCVRVCGLCERLNRAADGENVDGAEQGSAWADAARIEQVSAKPSAGGGNRNDGGAHDLQIQGVGCSAILCIRTSATKGHKAAVNAQCSRSLPIFA